MGLGLPPPSTLPSTPVTPEVQRRHNNRLGAAYLSLHGFWHSRQVAVPVSVPGSNSGPQGAAARRDSYSLIFFNHGATTCFENDFQRTPESMLKTALQTTSSGGTNYDVAIRKTEVVMRTHWSSERYGLPSPNAAFDPFSGISAPVVIFLSDGECSIEDATMRTFCRAAIALGSVATVW